MGNIFLKYMEPLKNLPIELFFVAIAFCGGLARYLNGYANGAPFKFSIFLSSGMVAGFSGWMFAIFGSTMNLPQEMLFVMAGVGGFFGEQTLKFLMEYVTKEKKQ